ncbi:PhzF family phenazine biosynthesis protein [Hyphomonas sp. WL0036]|uniref:PhzF family phenazine biosynthesis protein n=1 Tax=Hyphomonas sediminis TaxID=2866160 RepID=UPI001C7ED9A4|nr:PhzF family phenazine biosynthesis protein [Hyphomonas sediminis]MBY9066333.1 PhzF family phenazine biosynthesis protein [Hyphomonas sediminis]
MPVYPFYQVDAFASRPFEGNQACVMPMEAFLADDELLRIAAENNVAETAYLVPKAEGVWALRWFTPAVEVPLCGHATLASAHVLFDAGGFSGDVIHFDTVKSGRLSVRRLEDGRLEMDFPSAPIRPVPVTDEIAAALGARPLEAWGGMFYAARFESAEIVRGLTPDVRALKVLGADGDGWDRGNFGCFALGGEPGLHATSRFFAPGSGIDEDPATGSWHTMLSRILGTHFGLPEASCWQAYPGRGAQIDVKLEGDRVKLVGRAVTVIEGQFRL